SLNLISTTIESYLHRVIHSLLKVCCLRQEIGSFRTQVEFRIASDHQKSRYQEIEAAASFLTRLVTKNLSTVTSEQVERFRFTLASALHERYEDHWFPNCPTKGQAYRCIRLNESNRSDPILNSTCLQSGINYSDLQLPLELTLWVDPEEVTCRFGEHRGSHCILAKFRNGELQENLIDQIDIDGYNQQTIERIRQSSLDMAKPRRASLRCDPAPSSVTKHPLLIQSPVYKTNAENGVEHHQHQTSPGLNNSMLGLTMGMPVTTNQQNNILNSYNGASSSNSSSPLIADAGYHHHTAVAAAAGMSPYHTPNTYWIHMASPPQPQRFLFIVCNVCTLAKCNSFGPIIDLNGHASEDLSTHSSQSAVLYNEEYLKSNRSTPDSSLPGFRLSPNFSTEITPINSGACSRLVETATSESHNSVHETVIKCSGLNSSTELNELAAFANESGPQYHLHQLHVSQSDFNTTFAFLELIAAHYDFTNLRVLNLSNTHIYDVARLQRIILQMVKLEILDVSRTGIDSLEFMMFDTGALPNLVQLNIDGNSLKSLDFDVIMKRWPKMQRLSATHNNIGQIKCNNTNKLTGRFVEIRLMNNTLNCNKALIWLVQLFVYAEEHFGPPTTPFVDYEHVKCALPDKGSEMTWTQRLSVLETKTCQQCDCQALKKTAIGVNCYKRGLTHLPESLPTNTKVLNLTSNRIGSLYLPNNSKNWLNVTYVYLDDNVVTSFKGIETNSKLMKNLVALDIRKNRLQEVPIHILDQFTHLDQVHLSDNPWSCDCNTISFQGWLQNHFSGVLDVYHIKCAIYGNDINGVSSLRTNQRLASKIIYRLSKSELCPQNDEPIDWLDVFNISLAIIIVLIIIKVFLDYMYQKRTSKLPRFFKLNSVKILR
ncbi:Protein BTG3, partial [Fragariocoptes setiger]